MQILLLLHLVNLLGGARGEENEFQRTIFNMTAYKCASHTSQIQSISLTRTQNCEQERVLGAYHPPRDSEVEIVKKKTHFEVTARSCFLEYDVIYASCGYGITWAKTKLYSEKKIATKYVHITEKECRNIHSGQNFQFPADQSPTSGHAQFVSIKLETGIKTKEIFLSGKGSLVDHLKKGYGNCQYVTEPTYEDKTFSKGVIYIKARSKILTHSASYHLGDASFHMPGISSGKHFVDNVIYGSVIFEEPQIPSCAMTELHAPTMAKIYFPTKSHSNVKTLVTLQTEKRAIGIALMAEKRFCNVTLYSTSLTDVFVNVINETGKKISQLPLAAQDITQSFEVQGNLHTLYVQLETNLDEAFSKVAISDCRMRRQMYLNILDGISQGGSVMTLAKEIVGRSVGVEGHISGSSLYIVNCSPETANIVQLTMCTQEIPVLLSSGSPDKVLYVHPVTRIVGQNFSRIPCETLPVIWDIGPTFLCSNPQISECTNTSLILDPNESQSYWNGSSSILSKSFVDARTLKDLENIEKYKQGIFHFLAKFGYASISQSGGAELAEQIVQSLGNSGSSILNFAMEDALSPIRWIWRALSPVLTSFFLFLSMCSFGFKAVLLARLIKDDIFLHASLKRAILIVIKNIPPLLFSYGTLQSLDVNPKETVIEN